MKYEMAKVGQKIHYQGGANAVVSPCQGIIRDLYPPDPKDAPDDYGFALVEVDQKPENWPYETNEFAPSVSDLLVSERTKG